MSHQHHAHQLLLLGLPPIARSCFCLVANILMEPLRPSTMTSLSTLSTKMSGEESRAQIAHFLVAGTLGVEGATLGAFTFLEVCDDSPLPQVSD